MSIGLVRAPVGRECPKPCYQIGSRVAQRWHSVWQDSFWRQQWWPPSHAPTFGVDTLLSLANISLAPLPPTSMPENLVVTTWDYVQWSQQRLKAFGFHTTPLFHSCYPFHKWHVFRYSAWNSCHWAPHIATLIHTQRQLNPGMSRCGGTNWLP